MTLSASFKIRSEEVWIQIEIRACYEDSIQTDL